MGRTYLFECPQCEYRVTVSGGREHGLACHVQTIRCGDCSALVDVPTRVRVAGREISRRLGLGEAAARQNQLRRRFAQWHLRLPVNTAASNQWFSLKLRCPVSPLHRIEPWSHPGRCPRCGVFMDRTVMPYRIWE